MRIPWIRSARYAPVALLGLALLVGPGRVRAARRDPSDLGWGPLVPTPAHRQLVRAAGRARPEGGGRRGPAPDAAGRRDRRPRHRRRVLGQRRLHAYCGHGEVGPLAGRLPQGLGRQRFWEQRVSGLRRPRADGHCRPVAGARRPDHRAGGRDLHAVPQPDLRPAGGQGRHARSGIGLFFTFGASDGNPNPLQYFYNLGIGGNGVVPGRPQDTFGIGWARTQFSGDFVPLLRQTLDLGLTVEDAIELYYNAVVTAWLNATLDLQIVNPGLKKALDASGTLRGVNTAVMPRLRLYVRF
jgi:Carbohydrate-selective porin, OprB family